MEENRNNGFFKGFLLGGVITLIISLGLCVAVIKLHIDKQMKNLELDTTVESKITVDSSFTEKLSYLQMLIDNNYLDEYETKDLIENAYKGYMAGLGDPYSVYYTADEYKAFMEQSSGIYCGIGVQVSQNTQTGIITATKVFENSPGAKAGILPNDVLYKVNDEEVTGIDLTTVVSKIKGDEGTNVDITVYRESINDYVTMTVTRQKIEVPTVEYEMLDNNIGYIILSGFEEVTANQFVTALKSLESQGMKGLIVDVRDNPGGLLSSVNDILKNLLPKGLIVYTIDKNGKKVTYECDGSKEIKVPMVVLTNGNSASAAEIFSGALQDYKKATLVGTKTFGKGIVQTIMPLTDGSAVKLTISKYYTPNGVNIHKTGITPDIEVELDPELKTKITVTKEEDNQLQKAIEEIKNQIK